MFGVVPVMQTQMAADESLGLSGSGPSKTEIKSRMTLQVVVHSVASKRCKTLSMIFGDKVHALKQLVSQEFDVPISQQQLIFGSLILEDDHTLIESGLFTGATVHLVTGTSRSNLNAEVSLRCNPPSSILNASQLIDRLIWMI